MLAAVSLTGAGCREKASVLPDATQPERRRLSDFPAAERARHVNLVRGSVIHIERAFVGFQDEIDLDRDERSQTAIVIDRFAPQHAADLSWRLSVELREKSEDVTKILTANLDGLNLNESEKHWLPAFWPEVEHASSRGTSGIWISRDRFEGLSRNRVSTWDASLADPTYYGAPGEDPEVNILLQRLADEVARVENRIDVRRVSGDVEPVTVSLHVNGDEVEVRAIRAVTWYGEYLVLDNPQNPLILSFSFQDKNEDGSPRFTGADRLKKLLDYRVTELSDTAL